MLTLNNVHSVANHQVRSGSEVGCKSDTVLTVHWLWQVISVPLFKWQTLTTLEARKHFLRELLPLSSQAAQEAGPATVSTMPAVPFSLQGIRRVMY